jgi:beta-galactosidase
LGENHEKPFETQTSHETRVDVQVTYKIQSNGTLISSWCVDCSEALPPYPKGLFPSLPRVGLSFAIPQEFDEVNFYGRGPHENYADRKASARLSVHSMPVDDLHVPYIFPGECGGRTDTRWIQWRNPFGRTITSSLVSRTRNKTDTPSYCQFSSSFFSLEELNKGRHDFELVEDKAIHVHIDAAHMGVGGDDSWSPTVHEEYLVPPKVYEFNFLLSSSKVDPNEVWFSAVARPSI